MRATFFLVSLAVQLTCVLADAQVPGNGLNPGPCAEDCERRADRFLRECALHPDECFLQAINLLDACFQECFPPPEDSCGCLDEYGQALTDCANLQDPRAVDECAAALDAELCECIAVCEGGSPCAPPDPEPVECESFCSATVDGAVLRCLLDGARESDCRAIGDSLSGECLQICEDIGDRDRSACAGDCTKSAQDLLRSCAEEGNEPDVCRARANDLIRACLASCARDVAHDCEQGCGHDASAYLAGCGEAGVAAEDCIWQSNDYLSSCIERCQNTDGATFSCENSCEVFERLLVRECVLLGGDAQDCERRGGELRTECAAFCSGASVADDAGRCELIAREVRDDCLRSGGSSSECEELSLLIVTDCNGAPAPPRAHEPFRRGDAYDDERLDVTDAVTILRHLFGGGHDARNCDDALDVDDDGSVTATDAIYLLGYLFGGGPPPPAPHDTPGLDPTADVLLCSLRSS